MVNKEKLEKYLNVGINRLSIGLQTTNDELLKTIGRIHNYQQFLETYNTARKLGFKNINVDLMLGLPNQTIKDLKESLEKIIELNPEHISTYSLIVEENTKIEKMLNEGKISLPDEELERQMYWYVKNTLELNGYVHYEISNFAKKGKESKHNLNCWEQKEYIGVGLSACSYLNNERYGNDVPFSSYIKGNSEKVTMEKLSLEDSKKEYMLLGLRKIKGVQISKFKEKYLDNPIFLFRKELEKLYNQGLITIDGDFIRLTNKGLDLANLVGEEFV